MLNHLAAWLTMLLQPDAAVFIWHRAGNPGWLTFIYLTIFTFFTTILVFWGTGWLKRMKFIAGTAKILSGKLKNLLHLREKAEGPHRLIQGKIVNWLRRQKAITIFLVSCIPLVPILPTAAIVTTKLLEIRHGLILMLAGAAIRNALLVFSLYYSFWGQS